MVKKVSLPYTMKHSRTGIIYYRRGGGLIPLGKEGDPGLLEAYNRAVKGGAAPEPTTTTVAALIASYRRSSRWDKLSPRTRQDYEKVLVYLEAKMGSRDVSRLTRPNIHDAMEKNRHRARFANYISQVASILCEHAIDKGWLRVNPIKGMEKLALGEGWEAWPDAALAAYREKAGEDGRARDIFELARGTGQRIADVLKMRWDEIEDDGIWVRQNKGRRKGKRAERLWVPFTDELIAYLPKIKRRGFTILADEDTTAPLSYRAASYAIMETRKLAKATAWTTHGLRANRASELYEAGCTDAEVQAITGHASAEQARKYGRSARQRLLAGSAIEKMRQRNAVEADE